MVPAFQLNYCYSNCYRRLLKTSWHLIGDGILDKSIDRKTASHCLVFDVTVCVCFCYCFDV